jgi:hypothetical protein
MNILLDNEIFWILPSTAWSDASTCQDARNRSSTITEDYARKFPAVVNSTLRSAEV